MEGKIDTLRSYDIISFKKKCPAFEKSCPFKKLADDDFMKAVKKCPEFQDHCPFKDLTNLAEIYEKLSQIPDPQSPSKQLSEMFTAMHKLCEPLEQNLGNCPVFSQSPGCPFKNVQSAGVKLVDPVESVSFQQGIKNDLMKFGTKELKEKCPAFRKNCPYAKLTDGDFKNCPAFAGGCPFKSAKNLADVYDLLAKIPDPHSQGKNLLDLFQKIHVVSTNEKSAVGKSCPVFHDDDGKPTCPFKSVRSEGKHLVEPVKDVLNESKSV